MPSSIRLQAVSAAFWLGAIYLCMFLVLGAAAMAGLHVSFELLPTAKAIGLALLFVILAVRARELAPRVSAGAASFLLMWIGGVAAGVLCMVGAMFSRPLIDPWLATADAWLGITSGDVLQLIVAMPFAPKLLYSIYFLSVMLLFGTTIALSCLGRIERVWELCSAYGFCLTAATVFSVLFPAAGPFDHLGLVDRFAGQLPRGSGVYHLAALGELRHASQLVINPFGLQGLVTFPSFHTSMAIMTAAAWRDDRWLRWPMIGWNALVVVSTIPIGGHYIVDLIGGALIWFTVFRYGTRWAEALVTLRVRIFRRQATPGLA